MDCWHFWKWVFLGYFSIYLRYANFNNFCKWIAATFRSVAFWQFWSKNIRDLLVFTVQFYIVIRCPGWDQVFFGSIICRCLIFQSVYIWISFGENPYFSMVCGFFLPPLQSCKIVDFFVLSWYILIVPRDRAKSSEHWAMYLENRTRDTRLTRADFYAKIKPCSRIAPCNLSDSTIA